MYCAKGNFPHVQYAFYLHALDARRAVKCGMASVTWCDVTVNHRRAAHSIPHFTFRIPHAAVPSTLDNSVSLYVQQIQRMHERHSCVKVLFRNRLRCHALFLLTTLHTTYKIFTTFCLQFFVYIDYYSDAIDKNIRVIK